MSTRPKGYVKHDHSLLASVSSLVNAPSFFHWCLTACRFGAICSRQKTAVRKFRSVVAKIFDRRRMHMFSARFTLFMIRALFSVGLVVGALSASPVGLAQTPADGQGKVKIEWL